MELPLPPAFDHEEEDGAGNPRRFIPLRHIYSSTVPCIGATGASNVMSKKVKASKVMEGDVDGADEGIRVIFSEDSMCKVAVKKGLLVYVRRRKRGRDHLNDVSFFTKVSRAVEPGLGNGAVLREVKVEALEDDKGDSTADLAPSEKKRKLMKYELLGLGEGSGFAAAPGATRLRGSTGLANGPSSAGKNKGTTNIGVANLGKTKRWAELSFEGADPLAFVGLPCKIFWPMDDDWYAGSISKYILETCQHQVEYKDGDVESLTLSNERIKFHVSAEDMHRLHLKYSCPNMEKKASSYDEMLALAASYDDCDDLEVGDIVWAKISGYSMWPALIINDANVDALGNRKPYHKESTISVQFFGTHDFARINIKQVKPFLRGMLSSFHLKCKQTTFQQSLEEAKMYLSKQQLPDRMLRLQKCSPHEDNMNTMKPGETNTSRVESGYEKEMQNSMECNNAGPIEIGNLLVTSLGQVVCDSEHFHNKNFIWPEGYTAFRKFLSMTNPKASSKYKMEVLRNPKSKARPLFRVTSDEGEQIEGPNPTFCWKEIYQRIRRNSNDSHGVLEEKLQKTGSYMFGFSHPKISQLIQDLPNNAPSSRYPDNYYDRSSGYRAVRVQWKDIDRCNVCHMDEEYEDNLFLQCDKCRMMVHARCYGELDPSDGVLWFCNLCRPDAPKPPPKCCLCPVIGGAIKPTTDGRWAHLTCAMWIPETCLSDIKKMEPIDGLNRISKDRWKLLCSICGVSYGACIQCSNSNCYVAYHALCARAAGLCVELEDEDRLYLMSYDEDDDQCIRLLSFCKKHRQPSNERSPSEEQPKEPIQHCTSYIPPLNPSGCARSEPYNFFGRRGQKEPQVLAAASMKRLFVENKPYIVGGYPYNVIGGNFCSKSSGFLSCPGVSKLKNENDILGNVPSMRAKYKYMKGTYGKRLAFGKSRIHGFGVFAKIEHKAGDMVIEYIGELVRPPIADIREHRIYNSLVGAGTYMFRIDNERVVDATRAGSIAHLINHSCEPNCYSRMISVDGDDHIIIFAKRDIHQWEELSYDYRFFSKDEQLSCYCGFSRCSGVVNDVEAEEQITKLWAPRSELIPWQGD